MYDQRIEKHKPREVKIFTHSLDAAKEGQEQDLQ